jgi:ubiquitin-protein ligase
MQARLRRLQSDYDQVRTRFAAHPHIRLLQADGTPPDKYTFAFLVQALVATGEDSFTPGGEHRAEIFLPLDYPRRPPFCRMVTPIFHPNIDPQKICIGDHWSANQSLSEMVVRVAEMICFQSYNLKSPLNAVAAAWAEQNSSQLPLQRSDFSGAW